MNNKTCLLLSLCLGAAAALPAQTLFSDSLATDAANWVLSPSPYNNGTTAFTASTLAYSVGTPTADDRSFRTLNTYAASSTSSPGGIQTSSENAPVAARSTASSYCIATSERRPPSGTRL